MGEDVIGGRASLVADDGERENFHRSARALPATREHAGRLPRCYDITGQSLTSRLCRVPALMSLDPTGRGRQRWSNRWKGALNAFDIT
jgi:hypothetical protein